MRQKLKPILILTALLFLVSTAVVVVNQTIQFSIFMDRFHPILGEITFWVLILFYLTFALIPLFLFLKLPKRLELPESEDGEEFDRYIDAISKRLSSNPLLAEHIVDSKESVE